MRNNDKKTEVWLLHYKKHSDGVGVRHGEAVEEAICFGWIDGKLRRIDEEKFALRYSPRRKGSVWSLINKMTALRMIDEGRMTEAGMSKIEEAKNHVHALPLTPELDSGLKSGQSSQLRHLQIPDRCGIAHCPILCGRRHGSSD